MKRLILLRHAKSSWGDPDLPDHDRPLTKRGRGAVPVIAAWLGGRGYLPDLALCSPACRARDTYALLAAALPGLPEARLESGLYHAPPRTLLRRLQQVGDARAVMIVGHQPGLGSFARKLAGAPVPARCARAFEHFPTAAAAVLDFDLDDWRGVDWQAARFIDFARPRELAAAAAAAS